MTREYLFQYLNGIYEVIMQARVPSPIPRNIWLNATAVNLLSLLAKSPSDAELKIKNPAVRSKIILSKNGLSIFFTLLKLFIYPKSAMQSPMIPKMIDSTQYLIVTLYDGQPSASK